MISKKFLSITLIVSIGYIALHQIQLSVYSGNFFSNKFNTFAYSIYIPHGWRVLTFLIYGNKCILGMLIGQFFTGFYLDNNLETINYELLLAIIIAALCVPTAGFILKKRYKVSINNFNTKYIFILTFVSASINSVLVNFIRFFSNTDFNEEVLISELFGYFVGDVLGVILIVCLFLIIRRLFYLSIEEK